MHFSNFSLDPLLLSQTEPYGHLKLRALKNYCSLS